MPHRLPLEYVHLGKCTCVCQHCSALFWESEKYGKSQVYSPEYHKCCSRGRVILRAPPEYPEYIKQLYRDHHFIENIRAYNQMFSMTSLGANVDNSINNGKGPYVFRVSGQIYHWIGAMCPEEGERPRFVQLYIYDTDNEVSNQMTHFGGQQQGGLKKEIVEGLIDFLDNHNALVQLFRTARDKYLEADISEFKVKLYNVVGTREYELPTSESIGAIVFGETSSMENDFDLIVEQHSRFPQRVNKLHPCYMSLQFPLIFVYGEEGYHKDMKLLHVPGQSTKEILEYMDSFPELTPADRADIVDRVFERKIRDYVKFIRNERPFGDITVVLYTIEFKKRGLPHCHSLLWISGPYKVREGKDVDRYISAELPDPAQDVEGYRIVSELMMHGPCGYANTNAPCIKDGTSFHRNFPQPYCNSTYIDDDGYVHYR
nr:helitron helicase-like domain-containing protein [Tanacetum cinerariifolium]